MKLPAADLARSMLGSSYADRYQPPCSGSTACSWSLAWQSPIPTARPTLPLAHNQQPFSWKPSQLWSGFYALADTVYLDHDESFAPAADSNEADSNEVELSKAGSTLRVTTLRDGIGAIPAMLGLNMLLGMCMSIRPWLDEAIAMEQQAAETGQEPAHTSPVPELKRGALDGLRWFVREWLIKFAVKPRLEEASIRLLPDHTARKLLAPFKRHVADLKVMAAIFQWSTAVRLHYLLEGALFSGALLKAADLLYTTLMLGAMHVGLEPDARPGVKWYLLEVRAAVVRCGLSWAAGAVCAAVFALVDRYPLSPFMGQFAGETLAGMFLYPMALQCLSG